MAFGFRIQGKKGSVKGHIKESTELENETLPFSYLGIQTEKKVQV